MCIHLKNWCDGKEDCLHGEDEKSCGWQIHLFIFELKINQTRPMKDVYIN